MTAKQIIFVIVFFAEPNLWQDDKDRAALEVKTSMRVHWSSKEDGLVNIYYIANEILIQRIKCNLFMKTLKTSTGGFV